MDKMVLLSLDEMLSIIDSIVSSMVNEELEDTVAVNIVNKILVMGGQELEDLKMERDGMNDWW